MKKVNLILALLVSSSFTAFSQEIRLYLNYADQVEAQTPAGVSIPVHIEYLPGATSPGNFTWSKDTVVVFKRDGINPDQNPEGIIDIPIPIAGSGMYDITRYKIEWETCTGTKTHLYEINNWTFSFGQNPPPPVVISYCKTAATNYTKCDLNFKAKQPSQNPFAMEFKIGTPAILRDSCFGTNALYEWKINGAVVQTGGQPFFHTFPQAGKYEVCLSATNPSTNVNKIVCDSVHVVPVGSPCDLTNKTFPIATDLHKHYGYFAGDPIESTPSRGLSIIRGPINYKYSWKAMTVAVQSASGKYFSFNNGHNPMIEIEISRDSLCKTKRYIQPSMVYNYAGGAGIQIPKAWGIFMSYQPQFGLDSLLYDPNNTTITNNVFVPGRDSTLFEMFDSFQKISSPGFYLNPVPRSHLKGIQIFENAIETSGPQFVRITPKGKISKTFVPTYHPSAVLWEESVNTTFFAFNWTYLKRLYVPQNANRIGSITGYIYDVDKVVLAPQPWGGINEVQFKSDLARIIVRDSLLRNIAWTYVNPNGTFFLDSLPTGRFVLCIDHPGILASKSPIEISANTPDLDLQFRVGSDKITRIVTKIENKISNGSIHLFPNPGTDKIHISGVDQIESILVYNTQGKMFPFQNTSDIDIQSLSSGIYHLRLASKEGKVYNATFLKE